MPCDLQIEHKAALLRLSIRCGLGSSRVNQLHWRQSVKRTFIRCDSRISIHFVGFCIFVINTMQCSAVQFNTIQYNTIQYNTIQYNTIQYNTIQYNTIQYNTMQCNKERFSIECHKSKTKVITPTNHNRCKQHNGPIRTRSKCM